MCACIPALSALFDATGSGQTVAQGTDPEARFFRVTDPSAAEQVATCAIWMCR
jgi:hypothetical protein